MPIAGISGIQSGAGSGLREVIPHRRRGRRIQYLYRRSVTNMGTVRAVSRKSLASNSNQPENNKHGGALSS